MNYIFCINKQYLNLNLLLVYYSNFVKCYILFIKNICKFELLINFNIFR